MQFHNININVYRSMVDSTSIVVRVIVQQSLSSVLVLNHVRKLINKNQWQLKKNYELGNHH